MITWEDLKFTRQTIVQHRDSLQPLNKQQQPPQTEEILGTGGSDFLSYHIIKTQMSSFQQKENQRTYKATEKYGTV